MRRKLKIQLLDSYCNRIWPGSGVEVAPDACRCVHSRQGSDDLSVERQWSQPIREE